MRLKLHKRTIVISTTGEVVNKTKHTTKMVHINGNRDHRNLIINTFLDSSDKVCHTEKSNCKCKMQD